MDDKTKLYVFTRKELALVAVFIILISIISFIFGVKLGKGFSFEMSGLQNEDREKVELLSGQEEIVKKDLSKITPSEIVKGTAETENIETAEKGLDKTYDKLKEEFGKLDAEMSNDDEAERPNQNESAGGNNQIEQEDETARPESLLAISDDVVKEENDKIKDDLRDEYSGKYTIQLGSHRSINDAKKFADGFKIRGYEPIINEVEIKGKGTWFRVSLGSFSTINDAKSYIIKEKSLFNGTDYFIVKFD